MAIFALVIPTLSLLAEETGSVNPIAVGLIVYIATAGQWFFPYENLSIAVGLSEHVGKYSEKDALLLGICATGATLLTILFSLGWWRLIGLL